MPSKVSLTCYLLTAVLFTKFLFSLYSTYLYAFEYTFLAYLLASLHLFKSIQYVKYR